MSERKYFFVNEIIYNSTSTDGLNSDDTGWSKTTRTPIDVEYRANKITGKSTTLDSVPFGYWDIDYGDVVIDGLAVASNIVSRVKLSNSSQIYKQTNSLSSFLKHARRTDVEHSSIDEVINLASTIKAEYEERAVSNVSKEQMRLATIALDNSYWATRDARLYRTKLLPKSDLEDYVDIIFESFSDEIWDMAEREAISQGVQITKKNNQI